MAKLNDPSEGYKDRHYVSQYQSGWRELREVKRRNRRLMVRTFIVVLFFFLTMGIIPWIPWGTEDASQQIEAQIAAQVERAQVEAEGAAQIYRDIISKHIDIEKTTSQNISVLSGDKSFNWASDLLARADADFGSYIASVERGSLSATKKAKLVGAAIKNFVDLRGREVVAEIELQKKAEAAKKDGGPEKP